MSIHENGLQMENGDAIAEKDKTERVQSIQNVQAAQNGLLRHSVTETESREEKSQRSSISALDELFSALDKSKQPENEFSDPADNEV